MNRDTMGSLPNGMWAHRKPTRDEKRVRKILKPWFNNERDENGERIKLSVYIARLYGEEE